MPIPESERESSKVPMVDEENFPPHRRLLYGDITYTLGHQIARGGYSTVYKAQDSWNNSLAIKEFTQKANPGMWENEVSNYMQLRHPKIVYMYGAFQLEGISYIALEYAGLSIGRINLRDGRERRLILMFAAKCMLEALHFMHGKGFVHTDINPGNALLELTSDNRPLGVKLCDMGLTVPQDRLRPGKHKAKWNPSPETIDHGEFGLESPAMDVYSTAQILMELMLDDGLERYTDEEICTGALRDKALSFDDPLGDALATALTPHVKGRATAMELWKAIRKAGYDRK
jgi:serine/threonine protein kinase